MSIIRVHRKDRDFFTAKKEALENANLSFKAKGLWAYAMSRKDDWQFHVSHLVKVSKEGRDAVYTAIDELMEVGYIYAQQTKDAKGRWETMDYVVFETLSDAAEFKKSLPLPENPDAGPSNADNPPLVKNDSSKDRSNISPIVPKGDIPSPRRKKAREEKTEVSPGVFLTTTQSGDLLRRLDQNQEKLKACYDKLSAWKIGKSITGGLDYKSILNWVIKAVSEDMNKPKPVDKTESHKQLAEKVKLQFPNNRDIELGYNYIEFRMGRMGIPDPHLKFGDHGFEEQLENNLRKLGLNLGVHKLPEMDSSHDRQRATG